MPDEYRTTPSAGLTELDPLVTPLANANAPNMLTARLAPGAQLYIWSLRTWRRLAEDPRLPEDLLQTPYRYHNLLSALVLIEEMMVLFAVDASRPIEIVKPYRRQLSDDEMKLVAALRLVGGNRQQSAQSLLSLVLPVAAARTLRRLLGNYVSHLHGAGLATCSEPELRLVCCHGTGAQLRCVDSGGIA